ncbi:EthD domain-containing protein [Actinomadura fibrosa]|uniref:EthD domain-containing protein n=1 Tax=Actinomadura fibrosa TaxID=111802 RepID=A0ABW2XQG4_9ACTN|nr:EthD domain-containing protein [Actinomadura fibrosa]
MPLIKTVACIRRKPSLTVEEFATYWRENHSEIVTSVAGDLKIKRYVQSHLLRGDLTDLFSGSRNGIEPFDGIAEVWFDADDLDGEMTAAQLHANLALLEDERNFIDIERSAFFFTTEIEFIGAGA